MLNKIAIVFSILVLVFFNSAYIKPDAYKIDAEKNAILHNNLGLKAVSEKYYRQAIQEFELAIALNPNTQATSVYYNNLGETYMKIGYPKQAQTCFENAIKQYSLNFRYYQNLVNSFNAQGILEKKIIFYQSKKDKNPLNAMLLGLLYVSNGDVRRGIIKLDEFCMSEPSLLITPAVRDYLNTLLPKED